MLRKPPTLSQTVYLLTMWRGDPLPALPATRRTLLKRAWIAPPRPFAMTDGGREALASSPFLAQAQRTLDRPPLEPLRRARVK